MSRRVKQTAPPCTTFEGWHVIAEANRIFGYDAWDRRTLAAKCVWTGTSEQSYLAAYTAKVRIRVRAGDVTVVCEGSGTGEGRAATPGQAHEIALNSPPRPTPPSGRSRRSATCSGLPFMTANKPECANTKPSRHRHTRGPRDRGSCAQIRGQKKNNLPSRAIF